MAFEFESTTITGCFDEVFAGRYTGTDKMRADAYARCIEQAAFASIYPGVRDLQPQLMAMLPTEQADAAESVFESPLGICDLERDSRCRGSARL